MFAVEFIPAHRLVGVDPEDASWTRCVQKHETQQQAEDESRWLSMEGPEYVYRVVGGAS